MIDAFWMQESRAMLAYTKTATTWLLTRNRREGTQESKLRTTAHMIYYTITGLIFALVVWPLFAIGAYTIIASLMHF